MANRGVRRKLYVGEQPLAPREKETTMKTDLYLTADGKVGKMLVSKPKTSGGGHADYIKFTPVRPTSGEETQGGSSEPTPLFNLYVVYDTTDEEALPVLEKSADGVQWETLSGNFSDGNYEGYAIGVFGNTPIYLRSQSDFYRETAVRYDGVTAGYWAEVEGDVYALCSKNDWDTMRVIGLRGTFMNMPDMYGWKLPDGASIENYIQALRGIWGGLDSGYLSVSDDGTTFNFNCGYAKELTGDTLISGLYADTKTKVVPDCQATLAGILGYYKGFDYIAVDRTNLSDYGILITNAMNASSSTRTPFETQLNASSTRYAILPANGGFVRVKGDNLGFYVNGNLITYDSTYTFKNLADGDVISCYVPAPD